MKKWCVFESPLCLQISQCQLVARLIQVTTPTPGLFCFWILTSSIIGLLLSRSWVLSYWAFSENLLNTVEIFTNKIKNPFQQNLVLIKYWLISLSQASEVTGKPSTDFCFTRHWGWAPAWPWSRILGHVIRYNKKERFRAFQNGITSQLPLRNDGVSSQNTKKCGLNTQHSQIWSHFWGC